jgi:hypothetical protein
MKSLSVLVPSVRERWDTFGTEIQRQLWKQYDELSPDGQQQVEILYLSENRCRALGDKRNVMVDIAQGEYCVFVDDDDVLADDYLSSLIEATGSGSDCVTFLVSVTINGGPAKICEYSTRFERDRNTATGYERLPNHICAVRREIALKAPYQPILRGEDAAYARDLKPLLTSEHHIDKVLYHYRYSDATTITQHHVSSTPRRKAPAIADVVILSKAAAPQLAAMTQKAVDTAVVGALPFAVNVIVVEQEPRVSYGQAHTIHQAAPFAFNRFLNIGARQGTAEWVMFSNNDVIYTDGWLTNLIAANHPVVSPLEPADVRMAGATANETGTRVGRHLAGWAFMMKREIWQQIGELDEDFDGWCADDALIEQLSQLSIKPMLVVDAIVNHLGSKTLVGSQEYDDLTWGGIHKFEHKYRPHALGNNANYLRWKAEKRPVHP